MNVFHHIFLLVLGGLGVYFMFIGEKGRFNMGRTGLYVKLSKANCSEKEFIAKLKESIFKSFAIRFAIVGVAGFAFNAYFQHIDRDLGNLGGLSGLEYLSIWVSVSMIALYDRVIIAFA